MDSTVVERWERDHRLVARCLAGDAEAWEALIRRYRRLVYSVPIAFRLSADDADDVFQRVSLKLLENLSRLRRTRGLAAWLMTTTRRECVALSRKRSRWQSLSEERGEEPAENPEDLADRLARIEAEHALALALERIEPRCRELLTALYIEEPSPSYQELAARLRRPIGSLGPTRARCLRKLRALFESQGGRAPWTTENR